jgi:hypothetical protein
MAIAPTDLHVPPPLLQRLDAWASCNSGSGPEQREVEDTLDVAGLVHQLRQQRMGMVQVGVLLLLSLKHGALARLW